MDPARGFATFLLLAVVASCAPAGAPPLPGAEPRTDAAGTGSALPPVLPVRGPLDIRVAYPGPTVRVAAHDSSFLYGSIGSGDATLTVNGAPARVWPNGAWLAWVALPPDSVMQFRLVARTSRDSARLDYAVHRAGWTPPRRDGLWLDTLSLTPRGRVWWPAAEYLTLAARASEGAALRLRLPDGTVVPLTPGYAAEPVPEGVRAFDRDTTRLITPIRRDRYTAVLRGRPIGPSPGPVLPPRGMAPVAVAPEPDSAWAILEAARGVDTIRARWPLQLALLDTVPLMAQLDDDTAGSGGTDGLTPGRTLPGGTYLWFFPTGTRAAVSGRMNGDLRLRLSPGSDAWVSVTEALPVPREDAVPAVVGSVTMLPEQDRVRVRIPLGRRVPFAISETEREITLRVYDAVGDVNWIRYGAADSLVRRVAWDQPAAREVTLAFELSRPLWGYRVRWQGTDLVLEIRRPPRLDPAHPLRGRLIALDPGHPPAGAAGPTGLREAEANLAIALALRGLLEADGARVLLTRTADVPLDLWPRIDLAERGDAEVLVSIHNNALPDGVNPFTNHGTSVYYNQPRSVPLARAIQDALVRRLGLRDLGIGRGDLALVRPTWMPSVLTEGLFIIMPDQEAALRSPSGRRLYAEAVRDGLRRFLRERAGAGR
jgi:N-acetylmuramoyl-L-alanine amidase